MIVRIAFYLMAALLVVIGVAGIAGTEAVQAVIGIMVLALAVVCLWVVPAILVGYAAARKGRSRGSFTLLSLLLWFPIPALVVACMAKPQGVTR